MKSNPCIRTCRSRDDKTQEKHPATNAIKYISDYTRRSKINIENLKTKIADIKNDIIFQNVDIIALNETHLGHSDTLTPHMIGISQDRFIVHCDCNNRGSGVALIIKTNLKPKHIRINTILEILVVEISEPIHMIVISLYRPPSTPIDVFMNNMLHIIT